MENLEKKSNFLTNNISKNTKKAEGIINIVDASLKTNLIYKGGTKIGSGINEFIDKLIKRTNS